MNEGNQQQGGRFYLVIKGGVLNGKHFEIPPQGLVVGRSMRDDIVLPDGRISRHHAKFYVKDALCYVQDQGSRNGVLVEGKRAKKTCLKDGDTVDLGYCSMRIRTEGTLEKGPPAEEHEELPARQAERERKPLAPVSGMPLHPLALASLGFVLLAQSWHWIFAVGAVVCAVLALRDIRRKARHYGKALAVIGLVLGLVVGAVNLYIKNGPEAGASDKCEQNLRVIYSALTNYAAAHSGRYPYNLEELTYMGARERLSCPSCARRRTGNCTYLFLAPGRRHNPNSEAVIACDRYLTNHGRRGGYVLRADGKVEWQSAMELEPVLSSGIGR